MQSLVPTTQPCSTEARAGTSSQASSTRDVMRRHEGDDVTLAVVQGLASLTSRTGTLVVIVGGLVSTKIFLDLENLRTEQVNVGRVQGDLFVPAVRQFPA